MTGHSGRRGTLVLVALVVVLVNGAAVVLVQRGLPTGPDGHPAPPGRGVPVAAAVAPPGQLSGQVVPRGNGSPSPVALGIDGCDNNYAAADTGRRVCVPRTPPPGQRIDCAFLRAHGINGVRVIGEDVRRLAGTLLAAVRGAVLCAR